MIKVEVKRTMEKLPVHEVAKQLGVAPSRLYSAINAGLLVTEPRHTGKGVEVFHYVAVSDAREVVRRWREDQEAYAPFLGKKTKAPRKRDAPPEEELEIGRRRRRIEVLAEQRKLRQEIEELW